MTTFRTFITLLLLTCAHALNINRRATTVTTPVPTTTSACSGGPTTITPFNCDPNGYLIQTNTFYNYSLTTGNFTLVKDHVAPGSAQLQAIGYNLIDHYIYGYRNDQGGAGVFQLSSGGLYTQVNNDTGPSQARTFTGDVDSNGHLWLHDSANKYWQYDVTTNSKTYGQLLSSGPTNAGNLKITAYDWVAFPSAGPYFYAVVTVTGGSGLYRFNTNNTSWEQVQLYSGLTGTFGAQFGVNNGTLLAEENTSGSLYNFPINGSAPFITSHGPKSSYNDGARCFLSPVVQ